MPLLRALFVFLLSLGAALPACAGASGCAPVAAVTASHAHHMGAPSKARAHDSADRHADACIGCAADLPNAPIVGSPLPLIATAPVSRAEPFLASLPTGAELRPPRARA